MLTYNEQKREKHLKVLLQRTPEKHTILKNEMKCELHRIKSNKNDKKYSGVQEV